MRIYLYTDIPGSGKGWTLGVLAASKVDASRYVKTHHKSGKFVGMYAGDDDNTMICGTTTELAQAQIHNNRIKLLGKDI